MNKEYVVELFNIYDRDRCIVRTEVKILKKEELKQKLADLKAL